MKNVQTNENVQWLALDSKVLVVAVQGEMKDWAAYIGAVPGEKHDLEWQQVARRGTKLPKAVALLLFPTWKKLRWRP